MGIAKHQIIKAVESIFKESYKKYKNAGILQLSI